MLLFKCISAQNYPKSLFYFLLVKSILSCILELEYLLSVQLRNHKDDQDWILTRYCHEILESNYTVRFLLNFKYLNGVLLALMDIGRYMRNIDDTKDSLYYYKG